MKDSTNDTFTDYYYLFIHELLQRYIVIYFLLLVHLPIKLSIKKCRFSHMESSNNHGHFLDSYDKQNMIIYILCDSSLMHNDNSIIFHFSFFYL